MDSLTDGYRQKLQSLMDLKCQLEPLMAMDSIIGLFIRQLENEISQYQIRLDKATLKFGGIVCIRCARTYEKETMKKLTAKDYFCSVCEDMIRDDMVASVFEERHHMPEGTIKQDAKATEDPLAVFKEAQLVRKSGRFWMIHEIVWKLHYEKKYGIPKKQIVV